MYRMPKMQEQVSVQIASAICRTWDSHQGLSLRQTKKKAAALVIIEAFLQGIDSKRDCGSRFDPLRGRLRRSKMLAHFVEP